MKMLLLFGGIAFLLLGVLLLLAALVAFFVVRGRRAKAGPAARPAPPPAQPAAPSVPVPAASPAAATPHPATSAAAAPAPASAASRPPAPATAAAPDDGDATVFVGVGGWGALHGVSGPVAGRTIPIDATGIYIGRDRNLSQVIIEDGSVSKRHVWVGVRDGAVVAVDQSSTNGTYLNAVGPRITESRLSPGDTLIISDNVARFVYRR